MQPDPLRHEIDVNFDAFQRKLAQHIAHHAREYALIRSGEIVRFFANPGDADRAGAAAFPDRLYSIQYVTDEPVELGLYANAVG